MAYVSGQWRLASSTNQRIPLNCRNFLPTGSSLLLLPPPLFRDRLQRPRGPSARASERARDHVRHRAFYFHAYEFLKAVPRKNVKGRVKDARSSILPLTSELTRIRVNKDKRGTRSLSASHAAELNAYNDNEIEGKSWPSHLAPAPGEKPSITPALF